ncbi:MAG: hypothetical protein QXI12_00460 [Candidatus Methanomethyliaceae archaeon]
MKRKGYGLLLAAGFAVTWAVMLMRPAQTQSPPAWPLSYQGKLLDTNMKPVEGDKTITFSLWDQAVGGTKLWEETQTKVAVRRGLFHVLLGSVRPLPQDIFRADKLLYLEVQIQGESPLTPRTQLTAVPYALVANRLAGQVAETQLQSGAYVPIGGIIMWWSDGSVPDGWEVCDGGIVSTPGSPLLGQRKPDLRNRFPRGVENQDIRRSPLTGGSEAVGLQHFHIVSEHSHVIMADKLSTRPSGEHGHPVDPHKHGFTTTEDGGHSHRLPVGGGWVQNLRFDHSPYSGNDKAVVTETYPDYWTWGSGAHRHTGETTAVEAWVHVSGSHTHEIEAHSHGGETGKSSATTDIAFESIPIVPPYTGVVYIIRVK